MLVDTSRRRRWQPSRTMRTSFLSANHWPQSWQRQLEQRQTTIPTRDRDLTILPHGSRTPALCFEATLQSKASSKAEKIHSREAVQSTRLQNNLLLRHSSPARLRSHHHCWLKPIAIAQLRRLAESRIAASPRPWRRTTLRQRDLSRPYTSRFEVCLLVIQMALMSRETPWTLMARSRKESSDL